MNGKFWLWRHQGKWGSQHGPHEHLAEQVRRPPCTQLQFHNTHRSGDKEPCDDSQKWDRMGTLNSDNSQKTAPKSVANWKRVQDMWRMLHLAFLAPIPWPQITDVTAWHNHCGAFLLDRHLSTPVIVPGCWLDLLDANTLLPSVHILSKTCFLPYKVSHLHLLHGLYNVATAFPTQFCGKN